MSSLPAGVEAAPADVGPPPPPPPRAGGGDAFACVVASAASISGGCFGYEIGIIASVLEMDSFKLWTGIGVVDTSGAVLPSAFSSDITGWVVSSFLFGCILGSIAVYFLADAIGRRGSIFVGAALFVSGGALQAGATALSMFYAGRVVGGAGIGILSMVAPLYISETATTAARGRLIATQQLSITIGILAASCVNAALFLLGAGLGNGQWRAALSAQIVPGLALAVVMVPLPRSPRWLVSRGRAREARAVLARLRAAPPSAPEVDAELRGITDEVLAELGVGGGGGGGGAGEAADSPRIEALVVGVPAFSARAHLARLLELGGADCRRQLALVCWLQLFQQCTGINVVLYYAAELFTRAGVPQNIAATWCVVANAALLVIGTVPGMLLVDRAGVGRRVLLLVGAAAMCACLCAATALIVASQRGAPAASYAAVGALWAFTVSFSATWGPVVWVMQSEVLPLRFRAQGSAVGTLVNWSANAAIGKFTPALLVAAGPYAYLLFAAFCVLMGAYVLAAVPETAGVSLENMGSLFAGGAGKKAAAAAADGDRVATGGDAARLVGAEDGNGIDTRALDEEYGDTLKQ